MKAQRRLVEFTTKDVLPDGPSEPNPYDVAPIERNPISQSSAA
jgi:hypothetical protein